MYTYTYVPYSEERIYTPPRMGGVYRSVCLNSGTFAVSETASRRWWCIESLFPLTACALRGKWQRFALRSLTANALPRGRGISASN